MRRHQPKLPKRQRGAVAVVVGISIFVLVGMIGLALDSGQMFVNKTELQNAADACALAAARELDGNADALTRADAAGVLVGKQNLVGFQDAAVALMAADISYNANLSPNSAYKTSVNADPATARFAMCKVERSDIGMWFMGVFGYNDPENKPKVGAYAVATLAPSQTNCSLPIGFCQKNTPPATCPGGGVPDAHGLCIGDWIDGKFDAGGGSTGSFNWIDFTPPAGGAQEVSEMLISGYCGTYTGAPVGQTGSLGNAAAKAWNSRFGLYQNGGGNPGLTSTPPAPPDTSGFSYTTTAEGVAAWPSQRSALANFLTHRAANDPYQGDAATGLKIPGGYSPSTAAQHNAGTDRRIVPVPIVNCAGWATSQTVPIVDWACVLMLHPIGNPNETVYMEYQGLASAPGTPCASYGLGGGTFGPLVPVLVQ
jgi:hypothetical protein